MSVKPSTPVTLTISAIGISVAMLVGTGWRAANAVRDLCDEVAGLRRDVAAIAADRWTAADMERWAFRLERSNRENGVNLVVPDVTRELPRAPGSD